MDTHKNTLAENEKEKPQKGSIIRTVNGEVMRFELTDEERDGVWDMVEQQNVEKHFKDLLREQGYDTSLSGMESIISEMAEKYRDDYGYGKADTDGDGLTDGDEGNIYNTDPLKYDTDGDGVIDSDEILLGLDPNDSTDGDTEIKQSIGEDELRVNKYNDNFKISIDVEASNNVKRFIKQGVSRYSGMLSNNRSIIGLPISIEYNAGTIKSGTITFRLDDKFVDGNSHFIPNSD